MFKIEKRLRRVAINGKKPVIITISHKNNSPLTANEIKQIARRQNNLYQLKHKRTNPKMIIRGINDLGFTTIKSADIPIERMYNNEEDYYRDRVKFDFNYLQFYKVEITIY